MTEKARVLSVDGDMVTVGCLASACAGCHSKDSCSVKEQEYEAVNKKGLDLSPGDMVEIYLPPLKTIGSAFSVMIVPLVLFISGFLFGNRILKIQSEGMNVLIGLAGLASGFAGNLLVSKRLKKNSYPLIVSRAGS